MLIMDPENTTIVLEDVAAPLGTDHFWVLDLPSRDFTLAPLGVMERVRGKFVQVMINGFCFWLPALWNILVVDETSVVDLIKVGKLGGKDFDALVHGPRKRMIDTAHIQCINLHPMYTSVAPSLAKSQMLCHPIAEDAWVCVAPSDTYNKYLKNAVSGDFF